MKIHRVTMTGFGPYRDTETVDLDGFDDDGIFLITGRTGAGKTSILDAITYALFGSIPRYDGSAGEKVRSDYIEPTDPCQVVVELSTADGRFRVTRSPAYQRPKQRGTGTTIAPPVFELARSVGADQWEVVESKTGNAEVRIEEIVRLTAKQFLQVILLAQGQFQEFLVATSDKRRDLLRMLFDTRRFSDYSEALDARARGLAARLSTSATAIGTNAGSLADELASTPPDNVDLERGTGVEPWIDDVLSLQRQIAVEASTAADTAHNELDRARLELETAMSVHERQQRRAAALAEQRRLASQAADIDADRERVARARRSALVWHAVKAERSAKTLLTGARETLASADTAARTLMPDLSISDDDLEALVQQLTEQQGLLREAVSREQQVPALQLAASTAAEAVAAFDEQVRADVESRQTYRDELDLLLSGWDELEADAVTVQTTRHTVAELTTRLRSAEAVERTDGEIDLAKLAQIETGTAVTAASANRDALRHAHRAGLAGSLARSLVPDEPCLVCGSKTHPAPASASAHDVDDDTVERAEATYEKTVAQSNQADLHVTRLTTRRESEHLAAEGRSVVDLRADLEQAVKAHEEADEAALRWSEVKLVRSALEADITRLDRAVEHAHDRRKQLAARESAAAATAERAVEQLAKARGDHPSVTARLTELETRTAALSALRSATAALAEAHHHADLSTAALHDALAEHTVPDVETAEAGRLTVARQAELEERVGEHEAQTAAVSNVLASADVCDLPAEPIDLIEPRQAFTSMATVARHAVAEQSAAAQKLQTIERLTAAIRIALTSAADLREEFEIVDRLASTVRGQTPNTMKMALETFALAAELEEIVRAANSRLTTMSGGRYEFLHSDALAGRGAQSGLALDILDAFTGQTRPPQSLSGGEKFQASLALALGLAEVLTNRAGGVRLDTLFIDEGFGTLDADTLQTTMATLDNLREGGRTIGLISHVEAMKESIPAQLFVDRTEGGWSTIRSSVSS